MEAGNAIFVLFSASLQLTCILQKELMLFSGALVFVAAVRGYFYITWFWVAREAYAYGSLRATTNEKTVLKQQAPPPSLAPAREQETTDLGGQSFWKKAY